MKIIAFTGMPFSGKSEAVHIAKNLGIPVIRMGDLVWNEVRKRDLPLTNDTVGTIAHEMRKSQGKDVWAHKTIEKIEELPTSHLIVIDGVRNIEEIEAFKKEFGDDFYLVAIEVSDTIRHERALKRGRIDDSTNIHDIKDRDNREIQWGIQHVITHADTSFSNDTSLDRFRSEIKQFFDSF